MKDFLKRCGCSCKGIFCIVVLACGMQSELFSQHVQSVRKPTGEEYWYILKQAQDAYDYGEYGRAISLAEEAKSVRRQQATWEEYTLEQLQKIYEVRRVGDHLSEIIPVLENRNQKNALEIIYSYYEAYGSEYFKDSLAALLRFLQHNDVYPEADYLIGRVYRLEGETEQATKYMQKAYEAAELLNVPGIKYEILYDMADIAKNQMSDAQYKSYINASHSDAKYYTEYEKYLLDILADDAQFTNASYMNALIHLVQNNDSNSVRNFFVFYRSDNDTSLKALEGLSSYYNLTSSAMSNEAEASAERIKALKCAALGSIIAVTRIQDILEDRLTGYEYKDLADLLLKCTKYSDILTWGNRNGVWELLYNFAEISAECGYTVFATDLLLILKDTEPELYWRQKALHNPLVQAYLEDSSKTEKILSEPTVLRY